MIILAGGIWDGGGGGGGGGRGGLRSACATHKLKYDGIGTPKIEKGIHMNYTNLYPSSII